MPHLSNSKFGRCLFRYNIYTAKNVKACRSFGDAAALAASTDVLKAGVLGKAEKNIISCTHRAAGLVRGAKYFEWSD